MRMQLMFAIIGLLVKHFVMAVKFRTVLKRTTKCRKGFKTILDEASYQHSTEIICPRINLI